jgi:hypothetical protein
MGTWLIDPTDFTIAASGGDITGAALSAQLANNSVVVQATGGSTGVHGDIAVNDAISWSANSKLTLEASRNININQTISATGSSGQLALLYGQGASAEGNTATYNVNAAINLPTGQNFTTLLGSDGIVKAFTVIRDLGVAGSASATDLQGMSGSLAKNYALGANIEAKSTSTWNGNTGFAPIAGFTGTLDGLGHTVNGLVINLPGTASVGLIGTAGAGAVIQNIGLVGGKTVGGAGTGALVGTGGTSSIVNSFTTGTVTGAASTGGLVGTLTDGHISRSYATGSVSNGVAASVGGLLGSGTTGSIDSSYATGNVQGGAGAGGLVGALTSGNVSNSFASGSVTGGAGSGGLVGTITTGSITNTYATGNVKGDAGTGGLVGVGTTGVITNSYATGLLTGTGAGRGGLIGSTSASHVGSFWDPDTTGMSSSTGGTGVAMTHAQLQTLANFNSATSANHNANPNWDFNNTWIMYDGLTMPLLRQFLTPLTITAANVNKTYDSVSFAGGTGVNYSTANYSSVNKLANLDGTLTYGGTALGASNAGTYAIGLSGLYSNQQGYLITYVPGTLSIAKAPVSIAGVRFYDGTSDVNASIFSLRGVVGGQDLFLSGVGVMADQNTGVGKSISMGTLALRSGDVGQSGNYTLVGGTQLVRINAAELTLTAVDASKVYDGTLAITGTALVTRGSLFGTDALSSGGLSFVDKNVGNDTKTVTANGVTVLDGNAGANYKVTYVSNTSSTINPRPLLISAVATDKTYDGKTTASVVLTDNRVAGDSLSTSLKPSATGSDTSGTFITIDDGHGNTTQIVSGSSGANFADKNVGADKMVFVVGIQLQGKDAANYVANTTAFSEASITPKAISVVATGQNKVYDGTLTDALILKSPGLIKGDYLNFAGTGTFADTAAGLGKLVNVTGIVATGNDMANYSLISTSTTTTANITPKLITVLASAADKVYDGNINAVASLSSSGVLAQDIDYVQFNGAAKFSSKNVGVLKTVSVSGISASGSQAGNYQLKSSSASDKADITVKTLEVSATGVDKVYDGTNKATLVFNTVGVVNGDTVNVASKTALFSDKNVGTDIVVTATGIGLSGKDAANYNLSATINPNASTTTLADITAKSIGVTAVGGTMVYNASLNAPVTLSSTGLIKGDVVNFSDASALLDNKNVGTAKPVVVSGISIAGRDAANYALSNTTALTKATVTALPISVLATANIKTFDSKTDVGVSLQSLGVITGDVLNFTSTSAKFSNAAIGTNKLVTVSGVTATGADAINYKIISKTLTTVGAIIAP